MRSSSPPISSLPPPRRHWTSTTTNPTFIKILLASICLLITFSFYYPVRTPNLTILSAGSGDKSGCIRTKYTHTKPIPKQPEATTNILITGGAGYIGSHFTLLLLDQSSATKYNIILIDDLSRGDIRNVERLKKLCPEYHSIYFYKADVGDTPLLTKIMKKHSIEVVIHFAGYAYASESISFPLQYYDNTVTKTQHLLEAIDAAGIQRLVYSSSSATYGLVEDPVCDIPITETSPQNPVSPYGQSKLFSEHIIRAYATSKHKDNKPFSFALLRYFNVVGADPKTRIGPMPKNKFAKFGRIVDGCFKAVLDKSSPMKVYGTDYETADGTAIRDYIHVSDLVDAHLKVVSGVYDNNELIYNVGIGKGSSNKELVEACSIATGEKVPVEYAPRRDGDPPIVIGEAKRIVSDLNWKPQHIVLADTIKTAWRWRQKIVDEMNQPDPSETAVGDDPDAPLGGKRQGRNDAHVEKIMSHGDEAAAPVFEETVENNKAGIREGRQRERMGGAPAKGLKKHVGKAGH